MPSEMFLVSSLEKVFSDTRPQPFSGRLSLLRKDRLSFQTAYRMLPKEGWPPYLGTTVHVTVDSPLKQWVRLYQVMEIPSAHPVTDPSDGNYLRTAPGFYPDLLKPIEEGKNRLEIGRWGAFWVEIASDEETPAGTFPLTLSAVAGDGDDTVTLSCTAEIEVVPACLPEQELIHTEWFHGDCLADYYHVDVFSEAHWEILRRQIASAAEYGINMILTPVVTPPLDTAVGGERTTIQLVDITVENGRYSFGFDKLDRWIQMCRECGIRYFEIAHLYSQWGAKFCPKVMATVDGEYRRIFGWDTEATGEAYRTFLAAFLPALTAELERMGVDKKHAFFHISDEPSGEHLEQYYRCKEQVAPYLEGYTIMDALSDFDFYQKGVCANPVVATNEVTPFLNAGVPDLWVYYCCGQGNRVSNRFFSMPSARTRIIGLQFYKYRIAGFLQWGFNFYNSFWSLRHIDPFAVTDAEFAFPSGDAFMVYPGEGGVPWSSLRQLVFDEALHDLRALNLLESLSSREFVLELMEGGLSHEITFFDYPQDAAYLLNLRAKVNAEIKARI